MRLVTQTDCPAALLGDERCVRFLKEAGFDAIDWSFFAMTEGRGPFCAADWREHAQTLRKIGEDCGIGFAQAHAPFPSSSGQEPFDTVIFERIVRAMEAASILGVRNIIVHPMQHLPYAANRDRLFDMNLDFYRRLIPYCERFNIRVATENMWQFDEKRGIIIDSVCSQPETFCALLDALDSPWIVGCLDIGHSALVGVEPADFIRALGPKRLQALHVHDVDYHSDCHTMPFIERVDWESVAQALGEIGYEGDFTLEADQFLSRFPLGLLPQASALMAATGRYLMGRIAAHRDE